MKIVQLDARIKYEAETPDIVSALDGTLVVCTQLSPNNNESLTEINTPCALLDLIAMLQIYIAASDDPEYIHTTGSPWCGVDLSNTIALLAKSTLGIDVDKKPWSSWVESSSVYVCQVMLQSILIWLFPHLRSLPEIYIEYEEGCMWHEWIADRALTQKRRKYAGVKLTIRV